MPREAEPSLNEKAFVLQALREKVRIDGRELNALRPLSLEFGQELGVADVRWGETRCAWLWVLSTSALLYNANQGGFFFPFHSVQGLLREFRPR